MSDQAKQMDLTNYIANSHIINQALSYCLGNSIQIENSSLQKVETDKFISCYNNFINLSKIK